MFPNMYMYTYSPPLIMIGALYMCDSCDIVCVLTFMYFADMGNSITALCLLCYLLPDSWSKPDHNKIIISDVRKTHTEQIR